MDQVSRPMQIALIAVVLFAAVYFVALKPKSSSGGGGAPAATAQPGGTSTSSASGSAPGVNGLTSAINKAHGAVATSEANSQKLSTQSAGASGTATTPAATTPSTTSTPTATTPVGKSTGTTNIHAKRAAKHGAGQITASHAIPKAGPGRATAALAGHRVLAVLFYNPSAADDRSVLKAFKHLNTHKGKVVLVRAPIARLSAYKSVTAKVAVTGSPTFIVFDQKGHTRSFVGFVDPAELANHVADALHGFKAA
jgi:hypothetical protein